MEDRTRIDGIFGLLKKTYPDPKIALNHRNPLELLIATMLSAQCTDERVNTVTKSLFERYKTPEDYLKVPIEELEKDIKPTGFYHNKAKNIGKTCEALIKNFGSKVPDNMEDLLTLPGVARKTANIVLSNAYNKQEGIAVDTHVRRISQRLKLTENEDPDKIEADLMKILPREDWKNFTLGTILHGRNICTAKKPKCRECILNKVCPSASTFD